MKGSNEDAVPNCPSLSEMIQCRGAMDFVIESETPIIVMAFRSAADCGTQAHCPSKKLTSLSAAIGNFPSLFSGMGS